MKAEDLNCVNYLQMKGEESGGNDGLESGGISVCRGRREVGKGDDKSREGDALTADEKGEGPKKEPKRLQDKKCELLCCKIADTCPPHPSVRYGLQPGR